MSEADQQASQPTHRVAPPHRPTLVFDLETVPDLDGARRLFPLEGIDDAGVGAFLRARARLRGGSDFQPHVLHRIVSIGVLYVAGDQFGLQALGRGIDASDPAAHERALLQRFFDAIDKRSPVLVSWNGSGFDTPVLHYRALIRGVVAPRYWEQGETESNWRFNHYHGRFHSRHTDLMDVLSGYQPRAVTSLDRMASLLGYPGKLGMDGSKVDAAWNGPERESVHDYVEHDVLNTYLVYLRYLHMRGELDSAGLAAREAALKAFLAESGAAHHREFLVAWVGAGGAPAQGADPADVEP